MKRKPLPKGPSKAIFRRHAGTHKANLINPRRMRGGIRW